MTRPLGEPTPRPKGSSTVAGVAVALVALAGFYALIRVSITGPPPGRPDATVELGVLADPSQTYDPVKAGEEVPAGFRQLLRRDAILPIYDPQFIPAGEIPNWPTDTLVIGIALDGEAKAYPVSLLNRREMVIDSLAGIPVLVTW